MTLDQHLEHLKALIAPPWTNGWWEYAKGRALELAMQDSAYAALPVLMHAERERIKAEAEACRPQPKRASKSKPTAQREIVSRETTPAATSSEASKASTGQLASCSLGAD